MKNLDNEILNYDWSFEDRTIVFDFDGNELVHNYREFDAPILNEFGDQLIPLDELKFIELEKIDEEQHMYYGYNL